VEARADPGPVPARGLAAIVVDAVEVGPPAGPSLRRDVAQRGEQLVGDEDLRLPALDRGAGLQGPADRRGRLAGLALTLVVPGPPAQELAPQVGDQDRQLVAQR